MPSIATLTIVDTDSPPTVQFQLNSFGADQTDGSAWITVTLSSPYSSPVSVTFTTSDGTDQAGIDYTAANQTVTFAPGDDTQFVQVYFLPNPASPDGGTINLTLTSPNNATLGSPSTAILEVTNYPLPSVQFSSSTYDGIQIEEGAWITITLSNPYVLPVSVNFATSDGTAKAGTDYYSANQTLIFEPGDVEQYFRVEFVANPSPPASETVNLTLTSPNNASLGAPPTAILTITNNAVVQDLPVDSINVTDTGKGVGVDKNNDLGFFLDKNSVYYAFKWTVTRANDDSMKNSTLKQDIVQLVRFQFDDGKVVAYRYAIKDTNHPKLAFVLKTDPKDPEKGWDGAKKQWDKDGAPNLLTLDVGAKGEKTDGTPDTVKKEVPSSALNGKQFSQSDYPGYKLLGKVKNLVGLSMYNTFRVTTTLQGGKTIVADFKMTIEVNKVDGTWQKTTAKTDPKLPKTWP